MNGAPGGLLQAVVKASVSNKHRRHNSVGLQSFDRLVSQIMHLAISNSVRQFLLTVPF